MIAAEANLNNLYAYIGAVDGLVKAWSDPTWHEDYLDDLSNRMESTFMVETIAAKEAGRANIQHMFEWKANTLMRPGGDYTSNQPLFKFVRLGDGSNKSLQVAFLPSQVDVPLPDPSYYGFKSKKLGYLSRHTFRMKALVMETRTVVKVKTNKKHGLFIPSESSRKGYVMGHKSARLNPGGNSTGQFTAWWNTWFETRGEVLASERAQIQQETITKTGQVIIRSKTTGRFVKAGGGGMSIIKAVSGQAWAEAKKLDKKAMK